MDALKIAQTLRPDLNVTKIDGPTDWPDGSKQWWLLTPSVKRPGKNRCVGNIIAKSFYKEDEVSECMMHKTNLSITIYE